MIHAIADAPAVDVRVNDLVAVTNLGFPNVANGGDYLTVSAGSARLRMSPTGTQTFVLDQTVTLDDGTDYTVIASGRLSGTPAAAYLILEDDNRAPAAGTIRLRAVHGAATVGSVNIFVRAAGAATFNATPTFANVPFRAAASADVPAGTYQICIVPVGTTPANDASNCAINATTPTLAAGTVATAIARDAATGGTLGAILTVDRTP